MKAKKRGGGYRLQPMRNGKRYSLTFDHKPTKAEIEQALHDAITREEQAHGINITFRQACDLYNSSKKNVLSATTYREYCNTVGRLSDWFLDKKVDDLTQDDINRQINELALNRAPKTVRNYHGYIASVLGVYRPSFHVSTTLPKKSKSKTYMPTENDINRIITLASGTEYEIPLKLACYGLRRSEVCAITADDIQDNILHVHRTKVMDIDKNWIVQERTKTSSSNRFVPIRKDLAVQIKKKGYAFAGHPGDIYDFLKRAQDDLGIPHFTLHKMRHYFASKMSAMGTPDADILDIGGWETDHVMKELYRESLQNEKQKRAVLDKMMDNLF